MQGPIVEWRFPGVAGKAAQPEVQMSKFLKHKKNGSVYPWTPQLAKNRNMVPCNEDGSMLGAGELGRPDPYANAHAEEVAAREAAHAELANHAAELRQAERNSAPAGDSLDGFDLEALRAFAQSQNIEVDRRWGDERIRRHLRDVLAQRERKAA